MQSFRALGALPPDPQISLTHCEFLATRLVICFAVVTYGFPRKKISDRCPLPGILLRVKLRAHQRNFGLLETKICNDRFNALAAYKLPVG